MPFFNQMIPSLKAMTDRVSQAYSTLKTSVVVAVNTLSTNLRVSLRNAKEGMVGTNTRSVFQKLKERSKEVEMPGESRLKIEGMIDNAASEVRTIMSQQEDYVSEKFKSTSQDIEFALKEMEAVSSEVRATCETESKKVGELQNKVISTTENLGIKTANIKALQDSLTSSEKQLKSASDKNTSLEQSVHKMTAKVNVIEADMAKLSVEKEQQTKLADKYAGLELQTRRERDVVRQKNKELHNHMHCVATVVEQSKPENLNGVAREALVKSVTKKDITDQDIKDLFEAASFIMPTALSTPPASSSSGKKAQSSGSSSSGSSRSSMLMQEL
jgi:chromosome segregation ATPase